MNGREYQLMRARAERTAFKMAWYFMWRFALFVFPFSFSFWWGSWMVAFQWWVCGTIVITMAAMFLVWLVTS